MSRMPEVELMRDVLGQHACRILLNTQGEPRYFSAFSGDQVYSNYGTGRIFATTLGADTVLRELQDRGFDPVVERL